MDDEINDGYPDVPDGYFPLAPLEALAREKFEETPDNLWSDRKFAALVGTTGRTIGRWRKEGCIPWVGADIAAVRLGHHPMLVWPERWSRLDRGLVAGTDKKALRELDRAIEQVGRVMEANRVTAPVDGYDEHHKDSIFVRAIVV